MTGLLLCQCSTPKSSGFIDGDWSTLPLVAEVGHLARSSVVAAARSPGISVRTASAVAYQRTRALVVGSLPLPTLELASESLPQPGTEAFETLLDEREKMPRRTSGSVRFLIDGDGFFPEFLSSIRNAKRSIDSQIFIFDNDDMGVQVADTLKARAHDLPVRVLFDSLGTRIAHRVKPATPPPVGFKPPGDMGSYLRRKSRLHVRSTTNPAFMVDHTKLHIIDGTSAYLGGMNFGREYRSEWHDLMARIEGPVVRDLRQIFDQHWNEQSWFRNWTLQNALERRSRVSSRAGTPPPAGLVPLRVLQTDIIEGKVEIARALHLAIRAAQRRVWVQTPYLSEDGLAAELIRAAKRGVEVKFILPGMNESGMMEMINFAGASTLIRGGVQVYKYRGMTHLKAAICDGWAMFGSANCDTLSLRINRELNLAVSDPGVVGRFERAVFLPDFRQSDRLDLSEAVRRGSVFMEAVGDQL